jgi:glucose/arabinose dehydrogenase
MSRHTTLLAGVAALVLAACAGKADEPVSVAMGESPDLPEPSSAALPTVKVAEAVGWAEGAAPAAAQGLRVQAFATGLDHPRWLHVLPNGDVLVAESNAPERPDHGKGIRAFFMKQAMEKAGAVTPSANRISLLRDADGDGTAERKSVFMTGLNSPFGMALANGKLYVANTDGVVSVPYSAGATKITANPVRLTDLPAGDFNHHWTKNIIASEDGSKLYATVGSNSNIAEHGMEMEEGRAAIWEIDAETGEKRLFGPFDTKKTLACVPSSQSKRMDLSLTAVRILARPAGNHARRRRASANSRKSTGKAAPNVRLFDVR